VERSLWAGPGAPFLRSVLVAGSSKIHAGESLAGNDSSDASSTGSGGDDGSAGVLIFGSRSLSGFAIISDITVALLRLSYRKTGSFAVLRQTLSTKQRRVVFMLN
jgi:hypothetical protein